MKGSCVIIPCRFTYRVSMPAGLRVIWYLYQGNQYSPVLDERESVNRKYSGLTSLTGTVKQQDCSLKIDKLDKIHSQDRLFPWIDKNPINFYHREGHSFYDKTTQIVILGRYLSFTLGIFFFKPCISLWYISYRSCTRATAQHLWYSQSGRGEQSDLQCATHVYLFSSPPDIKRYTWIRQQ